MSDSVCIFANPTSKNKAVPKITVNLQHETINLFNQNSLAISYSYITTQQIEFLESLELNTP